MTDFDWLSRYVNLGSPANVTDQCKLNGNEIHKVTRQLLLSYLGIEYDGSGENKYCMIDYDHVQSQVSTVSQFLVRWIFLTFLARSGSKVKLKRLRLVWSH